MSYSNSLSFLNFHPWGLPTAANKNTTHTKDKWPRSLPQCIIQLQDLYTVCINPSSPTNYSKKNTHIPYTTTHKPRGYRPKAKAQRVKKRKLTTQPPAAWAWRSARSKNRPPRPELRSSPGEQTCRTRHNRQCACRCPHQCCRRSKPCIPSSGGTGVGGGGLDMYRYKTHDVLSQKAVREGEGAMAKEISIRSTCSFYGVSIIYWGKKVRCCT